MATKRWDRRGESVGNVLLLEHVNVKIPDQRLATEFYIVGLGLTRDPYLMVGTDNMWANAGRTQFHLPTGDAQVAPGAIGLVVPSLAELVVRLDAVAARLAGTKFGYTRDDGTVETSCPWGNHIRCHAPGPEFGDTTLGLAYVELPVERGTVAGIARFYERIIGAPARLARDNGLDVARVTFGVGQELIFRETDAPRTPYDGWHVAIYLADFGGPYESLAQLGLLTQDRVQFEYRFQDIVDPDTKRVLFTLEHEVRSSSNPLYGRPLVNRNPTQRQATYQRGRDAFYPGA